MPRKNSKIEVPTLIKTDYDNFPNLDVFIKEANKANEMITESKKLWLSFFRSKCHTTDDISILLRNLGCKVEICKRGESSDRPIRMEYALDSSFGDLDNDGYEWIRQNLQDVVYYPSTQHGFDLFGLSMSKWIIGFVYGNSIDDRISRNFTAEDKLSCMHGYIASAINPNHKITSEYLTELFISKFSEDIKNVFSDNIGYYTSERNGDFHFIGFEDELLRCEFAIETTNLVPKTDKELNRWGGQNTYKQTPIEHTYLTIVKKDFNVKSTSRCCKKFNFSMFDDLEIIDVFVGTSVEKICYDITNGQYVGIIREENGKIDYSYSQDVHRR